MKKLSSTALFLPPLQRLSYALLEARGAKRRMVATSVCRLHVCELPGRGLLPPVVLLHGLGSSGAAFARVAAALRDEVERVVIVDAPGHGESETPRGEIVPEQLTAAVVEVLGATLRGSAVVVGTSMGGFLTLRVALERPDLVRGLVLCSPGGAPLDAGGLEQLLRKFKMRDQGEAMAFVERLFHRPPVFAPLIARDLRIMLSSPFFSALLSAIGPEHLLDEAELGALACPVLVVWGASDRVLPRESLAFFKRALPPSAIIEEPEGVGHSPQVERPRELARRIVAFSRGLAR